MKVIKLLFTNDSISVSSLRKKRSEISNLNLNEIQDNTLFYTEKYIKKNSLVFSDAINSKNYNTVIYEDFNSFLVVFPYLNSINVKFNVNKSLSLEVIEMLKSNLSFKSLECYFIPEDYVHDFAEASISIKFNNDMLFTKDFVDNNTLSNLKSIYYKKVINFNSEEEINKNLESFLRVNNSLELIHLYVYSNDSIKFIVDKLNQYKFLDVDIFIHQNESNASDISLGTNFLLKINKKYSNKDREIKIVYSNEFFRNNIFRELTINGLKLSMVAVLYIGVIFMISSKYHEFVNLFNLRVLESTLADSSLQDTTIDDMDDTEINTPLPPVETPEEPEPPKEYINYYANIPTNFTKLLELNSDVVGWLRVNNTKANYPITKYTDNEFYLEHDIYKRKVITGWVFMDYRNDPVNMDKNTIIYGHNLISGYMFGDLKNTTNKDWYTNPDNQIITFNTLEKEMNWKIISMYRTNYTTDYLKTGFYNDEAFMNFINMIKERSIHNFNVEVNPHDKILTLSTCTGSNNRRMVIHAVLLD